MATNALTPTSVNALQRTGEGSYLHQQYPRLYGALGGFFGTAPDEFQGSMMDPLASQVRGGAEFGYPMGVAAALAPFAGGIAAARGTIQGGKAAQRGSVGFIRKLADMMDQANPEGLIPSGKVFAHDVVDIPNIPSISKMKEYDGSVPSSKLVPTQANIHQEGLLDYVMSGNQVDKVSKVHPEVMKVGDRYFILDGHHRLASEIANGKSNVKVHVVGEF
ncbi:MAG: hypothetical protein WAV93_11395 [Bacteroidales bacterium]